MFFNYGYSVINAKFVEVYFIAQSREEQSYR